jgi:hypothetical protein
MQKEQDQCKFCSSEKLLQTIAGDVDAPPKSQICDTAGALHDGDNHFIFFSVIQNLMMMIVHFLLRPIIPHRQIRQ